MQSAGRIERVVCIFSIATFVVACGDEDPESTSALAATAPGNSAPVISGTLDSIAYEDEDYSFKPTASDPDGDPITFGIEGKPGWADFDTETGELSGKPGKGDRGRHRGVVIWVTDGAETSTLPEAEIEVEPLPVRNTAPVISGFPAGNVTVGNFYDFIPSASDADGDSLSFAIQNRPRWAQFDPQIGRLSGAPGAGNVGSYGNIVISVSDGITSTALAPFVVVVNPPPSLNTPPLISGQPVTSVLPGHAYSFTPTASDFDGDSLTFSVVALPGWAQFDPLTGALSGTPADSDAGSYSGISISVSDGEAHAALASFSIEVIASNTPPTISGNPDDSVLAGDSYSFVPSSNDFDGDPLSFSVTGQPSWASFNTTTGALTGTPDAADVGTYANISITVSDGDSDATLNAFSIEVVPIASGSATLTWMPPTQNTDGSPLTDLIGYIVYWGNAPGVYQNSETLPNPGLTNYIVENLLTGNTYYFTTTAYNSVGLESNFSNVASKTIP